MIYLYPDGEQYDSPQDWKSDDYEKREERLCLICWEQVQYTYGETSGKCKCENTMNITNEEYKFLREIESSLGCEEAYQQLKRVLLEGIEVCKGSVHLPGAFDFSETPQGYNYWDKIMENYNKLTPKDLGVFNFVASRIGEEEAEKQLKRVTADKYACELSAHEDRLLSAFNFLDTPQGHDYWMQVVDMPTLTLAVTNPEDCWADNSNGATFTEEDTNYALLKDVLDRAYEQASAGKGKERHAGGQAFEDQPMLVISELLDTVDGMAFQVIKKTREGRGLGKEAAIREFLGAINYLAGMVIYYDRNM